MITANDITVIYSLAGEKVSTANKLKEGETNPHVLRFTQEEYDALDSNLTMQQKAIQLADLPDNADVRLMIKE